MIITITIVVILPLRHSVSTSLRVTLFIASPYTEAHTASIRRSCIMNSALPDLAAGRLSGREAYRPSWPLLFGPVMQPAVIGRVASGKADARFEKSHREVKPDHVMILSVALSSTNQTANTISASLFVCPCTFSPSDSDLSLRARASSLLSESKVSCHFCGLFGLAPRGRGREKEKDSRLKCSPASN